MIQPDREQSILSAKVTAFEESGWVRMQCPEMDVTGSGINEEEARRMMAEATFSAAVFIVQEKGQTGFPGDQKRLPLAREVLRRIEAGEKIACLFSDSIHRFVHNS